MRALTAIFLALGSITAVADCPQAVQRKPGFLALAVDTAVARASSSDAFAFIDEQTTLAQIAAKVGTPDGAMPSGSNTVHVYCLADGNNVFVASRDGTLVQWVRVNNKRTFKRK